MLCAALVIALPASAAEPNTNFFLYSGTKRMAERLEAITRAADPMKNIYRAEMDRF